MNDGASKPYEQTAVVLMPIQSTRHSAKDSYANAPSFRRTVTATRPGADAFGGGNQSLG